MLVNFFNKNLIQSERCERLRQYRTNITATAKQNHPFSTSVVIKIPQCDGAICSACCHNFRVPVIDDARRELNVRHRPFVFGEHRQNPKRLTRENPQSSIPSSRHEDLTVGAGFHDVAPLVCYRQFAPKGHVVRFVDGEELEDVGRARANRPVHVGVEA